MFTPAPMRATSWVSRGTSSWAASSDTAPVRVALMTWASMTHRGIFVFASNRVMSPVARGSPSASFDGMAPIDLQPKTSSPSDRTSEGMKLMYPTSVSGTGCGLLMDILLGWTTCPRISRAKPRRTSSLARITLAPPHATTSSSDRKSISPPCSSM